MSGNGMTAQVIDANQRYFDAIADGYDADPAQRYGCYHENSRLRYRRFLERNCSITARGLVVNLGCGTGNMMNLEASLGLRPVGLDISWRMLEKARRVSSRLVHGEVHCLPFPDGSVSLASCFLLLHHIYDHTLFFRELYRVLAPGGILFSDYDPNFYSSQFAKEHWLLATAWKLRRFISYRVMKVGSVVDVETARLADYYSEVVPGLKEEAIRETLEQVGFTSIQTIVHSDGKSLGSPSEGRLPHKMFEAILWAFGERDYRRRAKLFAVVAQKPGGLQAVNCS